VGCGLGISRTELWAFPQPTSASLAQSAEAPTSSSHPRPLTLGGQPTPLCRVSYNILLGGGRILGAMVGADAQIYAGTFPLRDAQRDDSCI